MSDGMCEECEEKPANGPYSDKYCTQCYERLVAEGRIDPDDDDNDYDTDYNKAGQKPW